MENLTGGNPPVRPLPCVVPCKLYFWTHKEIIEEFLRYYDQMDDEIKELIPLKKIWVVSNDDQ